MNISEYVTSIEDALQSDVVYVEPSLSDPAVAIPRMINSVCGDMDELCAAALRNETWHIVDADAPAFRQIARRCELILGFLAARKEPQLKVVGGNQ
jgi:hypothetical protein